MSWPHSDSRLIIDLTGNESDGQTHNENSSQPQAKETMAQKRGTENKEKGSENLSVRHTFPLEAISSRNVSTCSDNLMQRPKPNTPSCKQKNAASLNTHSSPMSKTPRNNQTSSSTPKRKQGCYVRIAPKTPTKVGRTSRDAHIFSPLSTPSSFQTSARIGEKHFQLCELIEGSALSPCTIKSPFHSSVASPPLSPLTAKNDLSVIMYTPKGQADLSHSPTVLPSSATASQMPPLFSAKSRVWTPWKPHEYAALANYIDSTLHFGPIASTLNKSVPEVEAVLFSTVIRPLLEASEAVNRGNDGMRQFVSTYADHGSTIRIWACGSPFEVRGSLVRVTSGAIILEREISFLCQNVDMSVAVPALCLSTEDINYLKSVVTNTDWKLIEDARIVKPVLGSNMP